MVLVVAEKSRTFFSFPYLANEQMYKSWESQGSEWTPLLAELLLRERSLNPLLVPHLVNGLCLRD